VRCFQTPHSRLPASAAIVEDTLVLSSVGEYDAGRYECTASNGAGQPVTHSVDIQVHCKYRSEISKSNLGTAPNNKSWRVELKNMQTLSGI
jgi:hypothetical protein